MTPATSRNSKSVRKQIGPAVWLLAVLVRFTPADWKEDEPTYVAGGNVVSDADLGELLEVSTQTIATWRRRLRKTGLIGWLILPGQGRVFWVAALNHLCAPFGNPAQTAQGPAEESAPAKPGPEQPAPAASRWVQ